MAGVNRNAYKIAAGIAGDSPELDVAANTVANNVRAAIAPHSDTGDFLRSIKVKRDNYKGVTDRLVYSDDRFAYPKEFGHRAPDGRLVPGIHAFGKALGRGV